MRSNRGQAILELAIALPVFLMLFFSLDFLESLVMTRSRAEIFLHHELFAAYRRSEGCLVEPAPPPDLTRLAVQTTTDGFQGRVWLTPLRDHVYLHLTFLPHFAKQSNAQASLVAFPTTLQASIARDPWNEHPIKYATWGVALIEAIFQNKDTSDAEPKDSSNDSGESADGFLKGIL